MANQTIRVLELLKRFNNNQKVCIGALQHEYLWDGKCKKTIRRDLDIIKDMFPESFHLLKGEKGCYKALTKKSFENFLTPQNISLLVQTFNISQRSNIFESFDISKSDKSILEAKIKESKKVYEFKTRPMEIGSNNIELLTKLEKAIHQQKYIALVYRVKKELQTHKLKPYKLLLINENFYLASEAVDKPYLYSSFRVSFIKEVEVLADEFHKNPDLTDFITDIQTPFATYRPDYKKFLIEVILKIDSKKAHFFKQKKFLKSQQIIQENEDGSLTLSYKITQEVEIKDLIKQWMPYLTIIEPQELKDSIKRDMDTFYKTL